jgi:hypothetical protein
MATHRDNDGALRTRANTRLMAAAIVSLTATYLVTARHPLDVAVSASTTAPTPTRHGGGS